MPSCPPDIEDCLKIAEHDRRRRWYLNRGISVDTLIAMVVIAGSFMLWMMKQEGRMVTQEEEARHLIEVDRALSARITAERVEMRDDIKEIKEQVNKLVERRR